MWDSLTSFEQEPGETWPPSQGSCPRPWQIAAGLTTVFKSWKRKEYFFPKSERRIPDRMLWSLTPA